jgi:hypothetical protein
VREGKRWILREAGAHIQDGGHRTAAHAQARHRKGGEKSANA